MRLRFILPLTAALLTVTAALAQTPDNVLLVVNRRSSESREIGSYYAQKRALPRTNVCQIDTETTEDIVRENYNKEVEAPIAACLKLRGLRDKILYIVLTMGVPLKMWGDPAKPERTTDGSGVDSELTLLYQRMRGVKFPLDGPIPNPFFHQSDTPFRHPTFPIYLVTRLDAWTVAEVKALIDRSLLAKNKGRFAIDLRADENTAGNQWLRTAALLLPKQRVVMEETGSVLENVPDVIGYASWGSNDKDRKRRYVHMRWLPGAIATEFVSTDGRTMRKPPDDWQIGPWGDRKAWFAGAPQTLATDYIHEGASGASGQVLEPFLDYCPRPDLVLPAYASGRNLAESFYIGIPGLSWMTVVIGDPLMRLTPP
ncbi:MAG TPA: TIGR03790 family protein [Bryobacteraceae bacterium]|nr:TIGR03790 family protein [Bryobacteraceae bacterium]